MSENKDFLLAVKRVETLLLEQEATRAQKKEIRSRTGSAAGSAALPAHGKEESKAQRERQTRLTRLLVGLAELGDEAAFDKALAQGAELGKAIANGQSALMAALDAGQSAMARCPSGHRARGRG